MTTYRDTWEVDEGGNRFIFTVEMKRRLAKAGLPVAVASLSELPERPPPASTAPAVERPRVEPEPEPVAEPDIIQIDPETGKYIGRLKWYNPTRGYGFISRGAGEDIFFHKTSAIGDPAEMEEGQWVLYDVEERTKGPEATEVEPYTGDQV
jgi:cold shock protein